MACGLGLCLFHLPAAHAAGAGALGGPGDHVSTLATALLALTGAAVIAAFTVALREVVAIDARRKAGQQQHGERVP